MRSSYWSCSKFADWIRGTYKPTAETGPGWRNWTKTARASHPIRYWIAEEGLDSIQNFIYWPADKLHAIKYYINNRWVTRSHCLTAHPRDIKPGQWCDVGNRFLPCLFNELVEFVETELAWWQIAWADKEARKKYNAPFWAAGWFRWRTWRCKQAGLDSLAWQMKCDNKDYMPEDDPRYGDLTLQAINAKEIYELYMWWTVERPKRVDSMEASGWSDYCESKRKNGGSVLDGLEDDSETNIRAETKSMLEVMDKIDREYEQEDEDMMIRLIKVRESLWT
jgi:hypothetical protein